MKTMFSMFIIGDEDKSLKATSGYKRRKTPASKQPGPVRTFTPEEVEQFNRERGYIS